MSEEQEKVNNQNTSEQAAALGLNTTQPSAPAETGFDNSTLSALGGLVPETDMPSVEKQETPPVPATEEAQAVEEPKVDPAQTTEDMGAKEEQGSTEETNETVKIDSPIFGEKGLEISNEEKEQNSEGERSFEKVEDYQSYLKSELGFESFETLKESFDQLKEKEADYDKINTENSNIVSLFNNMPPELYNMVDKYTKGEDWKQEVSQIKSFDFSKDADDQDTKSLIDHYSPEKVSADDWAEFKDPEGDENIKKAVSAYIEISKGKFSSEKEKVSGHQERIMADAKVRNEKFVESVEKTVSNLSSQIEGIDESYVKKVSEKLRQNDINSLFYDKDGFLKEGAATAFVMAQDGFELMNRLQHAAKVKAKNEERLDILSRGAETANVKGSSSSEAKEVRPEIEKMIKSIEDIGRTNTTY